MKENGKDNTGIFTISSAKLKPFNVGGRRAGGLKAEQVRKEEGNKMEMKAIYTGSNDAMPASILVERLENGNLAWKLKKNVMWLG